MEFAGREENPSDDEEPEPHSPVPANYTRLNKKSTVCGDCTVVEDIDKIVTAPVDRLVVPGDIVDIREDEESIYIIGTKEGKVTKIRGLEKAKNLKGIEELSMLEKLELYDNHIETIRNIEHLNNLKVLDLSFNAIREMVPLVGCCPLLEELYIAQNKLRTIEGLEGLVHMRTLDLGANRIRVIQGLESNTALKSLWLGKNKIETISGLETLVNLRQLDIQHNRITTLGDGLRHLSGLEELYLAWNAIENLQGLPYPSNLNTIDLSKNQIASLEGAEQYTTLQELWLSNSLLATFESLAPLSRLPALNCLYLEHSPIAKDYEYRKTITKMIPTLQQLDATMVNRTVL